MSYQGPDISLVLKPKTPGITTCGLPLCIACLRIKGILMSLHSTKSTSFPEHIDVIKKGELKPRMSIGTYQYEHKVRG